MKRAWLVMAILLAACGGSSNPDRSAERSVCNDMLALARSGSRVLDDRTHWDPLLERAANVDYAPLHNNARSFQFDLQQFDKGSPIFTRDQMGKDLGFVLNRCDEVGVGMDLSQS